MGADSKKKKSSKRWLVILAAIAALTAAAVTISACDPSWELGCILTGHPFNCG